MKLDDLFFYGAIVFLFLVILTGCQEIDPNAPKPPRRECVKTETQLVPMPRITSYDIYGIPLSQYIIMRPTEVCTEWIEVPPEQTIAP